jgi:hypothetical protein
VRENLNKKIESPFVRNEGARVELGGDEEDRTPGLGIANAALSQLSYIPERS